MHPPVQRSAQSECLTPHHLTPPGALCDVTQGPFIDKRAVQVWVGEAAAAVTWGRRALVDMMYMYTSFPYRQCGVMMNISCR